MIEVEVKIPLCNRIEVEERIHSSEFRKDYRIRETDTYFDGEYYRIRAIDKALRIRSCENLQTGEVSSYITYKGAKLDAMSMTRKELETGVDDAEVCKEILKSLGLAVLAEVTKVRQYYRKGLITLCMDQVEELGDFLELEILVEDEGDREDALVQLYDILNDFGLNKEDTIRNSYLSMLGKRNQKLE